MGGLIVGQGQSASPILVTSHTARVESMSLSSKLAKVSYRVQFQADFPKYLVSNEPKSLVAR